METLLTWYFKNIKLKMIGISVVVPVYNASVFLEKTITSILMQKEVGELILVDDYSKDNSLEICLSFQQKDKRILIIKHTSNKGPSAARNSGIKIASCKYISFLDADDYYKQDRFKASIEYLESNSQVDGVYSKVENVKLINFKDAPYKHRDFIGCPSKIASINLFTYMIAEKGDFFSIISLLLRKEVFEKVEGFDESFRLSEDIDFSYALARACVLEEIDESKYYIKRQLHNTNLTTADLIKHKDFRAKLIEKWFFKLNREKFSFIDARYIFIRYIHTSYIVRNLNKYKLFKYPVKLYLCIETIIKFPRLIIKLI